MLLSIDNFFGSKKNSARCLLKTKWRMKICHFGPASFHQPIIGCKYEIPCVLKLYTSNSQRLQQSSLLFISVSSSSTYVEADLFYLSEKTSDVGEILLPFPCLPL